VHDYHQTAIVTRLKLDRSHQQIAYERFVSQGAIALLPLPDHECACIWSTETHHADSLISLTDAEYVNALQSQFGSRAGRFVSITQRHSFPLRMVKAQTATKNGVYLLGNAAHTFHPIAAQGFNLALYEVAVLVEAILAKREHHELFTCTDMQAAYEQTKKQQSISMGVSHGLSNGLLGDSFFQGMILQLGMTGLNFITPLKKRLLDHMLGRVGRVPRLLLGEIG
jgi:2-octaprenyl-6-methoxyphenol hydroxylase